MLGLINERLKSIEVSGIRAIANKVATDLIINIKLGQPDFPTPEKIKLAGKRAIDNNYTAYTHNAGLLESRQAVSDYINQLYGLSYRPEDEIAVTIGASEAIDMTFRTILEEGSEVIIPGPVYPGYEPTIKLCGATPVYIDTRETNFKVTAAMTGWRIGFVLALSNIASELLKVHLFNTVCASTISQYAAIAALTEEITEVAQIKGEYKRRRDYVYERAVSMGLDVVKPESAFYLFPSIKQTNMTSLDFALQLIDEAKVAVVPGSAFSDLGEGYIRFSFACSMETLEEGFNRIEWFLQKVAVSEIAVN